MLLLATPRLRRPRAAVGPTRRRRIAAHGVSGIVIATVAAIVCVVPAAAQADAAGSFVGATNQARAAAGLSALSVSADLTAAATRQAASMARSGLLAHTPGLGSAVCCWSTVGENVGEGPSVSAIHAAFMASSGHRANILSHTYTQIGVGYVVDAKGTLWVSEIFRRPTNAATPVASTPVVVHQPVRSTPLPVQKSAVVSRPTAVPAPAPVAVAGDGAASRALVRQPLDVAQRFAAQFADRDQVTGTNPVSRLLDFAAKAAASS